MAPESAEHGDEADEQQNTVQPFYPPKSKSRVQIAKIAIGASSAARQCPLQPQCDHRLVNVTASRRFRFSAR